MRFKRVVAVVIALAFAAIAHASASCSNANLKGNYGFVLTGLNSSAFFTASLGLFVMDGKGSLTGSDTISNNGVIASSVALTGSYTIHSNCSGTVTFTPAGGSKESFSVVIDSKNTRLEMIETDSGYTVSGYALVQGAVTCTLLGVKGTYGYGGSGWATAGTPFPTSIAGVVNVDGLGNLKGQQTGSVDGVIIPSTLSGTYTVNSDCTGTTTTMTSKGATAHSNVVLVDNGGTLLEIATDPGSIAITVGEKE